MLGIMFGMTRRMLSWSLCRKWPLCESPFFRTFASVKCRILLFLALQGIGVSAFCRIGEGGVSNDVRLHAMSHPVEADAALQADSTSTPCRNPVTWLMNYLERANKESDKPFDCSLILGPSYTSTYSFGFGAGLSGSYSWDRADATLPKSNVTLFANVSVKGFAKVKLEGRNYMPHDLQRWDYELNLENLPFDFWGIGYDRGRRDENKGNYHQVMVNFRPNYLFRLMPSLYVGPQAYFQFAHTYDFTDVSQIGGQHRDITTVGLGAAVQYDSRDFALNAFRGQFIKLEQMVFPRFANHYDFLSTEFTFDTYHRVWKGCILAADLHARMLYGNNVPWTMLAMVGQDGRMRGYYEGRYRDRDIVEAQVELRQHVYRRLGCVVWGGVANVFHDVDSFSASQTLPNYGVGVRWEFKHRVNVRFDFGFTRDKPGMEFKLNEAF